MSSPSPSSPVVLSVVIPARDAAARLPSCLTSLEEGRRCGLIGEIVVADGGSRDDTAARASALGARLVIASPGRGHQLAAGAAAARGTWLLFLHADTRLSSGWSAAVAAFIAAPENVARAGYFALRFDDDRWPARLLERGVVLRCRWLGLPYGDQGLLLAADFYRAVGGFRALPLMEDVDLVRRIGRHRLIRLDAMAITSASRYRRDGYFCRSLRNLTCLALYYLGVPPRLILPLYTPARGNPPLSIRRPRAGGDPGRATDK
jgi:rSAM/selenodomain-associated transferase 2